MSVISPQFLLLVGLGLAMFHASPRASWRLLVLAVVSAVFLTANLPGLLAALPLAAFVGLALALVVALARWPTQRLLQGGLAALVVAFLYLKQYDLVAWTPPLPFAYATIGLSYVLFRLVQLMVDAYEGEPLLQRPAIVPVLVYLLSFLTLAAGPIQRYEDFARQIAGLGAFRLAGEELLLAVRRIVGGGFKVLLLGGFFDALHARCFERLADHGAFLPAAAFAYLLYIYFNFAGYTDVVIGVGRLFGLRLPENFDAPFRATSFIDLWNRWHVTLSMTFRTYVFNPLLRLLRERLPTPWSTGALGVIAYFVVFALLGAWHGNDTRFLVYGLLLGLGVSVNKLAELLALRRLGAAGLARRRGEAGHEAFARAAALTYFAFSVIAIWPQFADAAALRAFAAERGVVAILGGMVASVIALGALERVLIPLRARAGSLIEVLTGHIPSDWRIASRVGLEAALLVFYLRWAHAPFDAQVLYQRY